MEVEIPVPAQPAVPPYRQVFSCVGVLQIFRKKNSDFLYPLYRQVFSCVGVLQIFRKKQTFCIPLAIMTEIDKYIKIEIKIERWR